MLVVALSAVATAPATASAGASPKSVAAVPSVIHGNGYVIVRSSDGVKSKDGTFIATGAVDANTMIVIANADGSLPGGVTEEQIAQIAAQRAAGGSQTAALSSTNSTAAATSSLLNTYTANAANWTGELQSIQSLAGSPGFQKGYTFVVCGACNQTNSGQGLGYYQGYNGSTFGVWAKWYGLNAAWSGHTGGGSVPWGNVWAYPKFKAKCATTPVCSGEWS